jgi:hypothetical protein
MRVFWKVSEQVCKRVVVDSCAGWHPCCDFLLLLSFGDVLEFEAWRSYPGCFSGFRGGVTTARGSR